MEAGRTCILAVQYHELDMHPISLASTHTVADRSSATEIHPNTTMSSGTTNTTSGSGSGGGNTNTASGSGTTSSGTSGTTVNAAHFKSVASNNFSMPPGTSLEPLAGPNWSVWHKIITAILHMNEVDALVDAILTNETCPTSVDPDDWNSVQKRTQAYLSLYCAPDVYSIVLPQLGSTRVNSASRTLSESRLDQPSARSWRLGSAQQST